MKNVIIFASGSGTNADNLMKYFSENEEINIAALFTNKPHAGCVQVAKKHGIPRYFLTKEFFYESDLILSELFVLRPDLIVLAGFLWKIPEYLISVYPKKIINLHPALLPKFGGKGMYGMKVHETVLLKGERESGITIHYVNEKYDEGEIIMQATCGVKKHDTAKTLASRIHELEYEHLPKVVEELLSN